MKIVLLYNVKAWLSSEHRKLQLYYSRNHVRIFIFICHANAQMSVALCATVIQYATGILERCIVFPKALFLFDTMKTSVAVYGSSRPYRTLSNPRLGFEFVLRICCSLAMVASWSSRSISLIRIGRFAAHTHK